MTPEEKAMELVDKFMDYESIKMSDYTNIEYPSAINLAKMVIEEIINLDYFSIEGRQYWQEVKIELDKL